LCFLQASVVVLGLLPPSKFVDPSIIARGEGACRFVLCIPSPMESAGEALVP